MQEVTINKQARLSQHLTLDAGGVNQNERENGRWKHPFARTYREFEATLRVVRDASQ